MGDVSGEGLGEDPERLAEVRLVDPTAVVPEGDDADPDDGAEHHDDGVADPCRPDLGVVGLSGAVVTFALDRQKLGEPRLLLLILHAWRRCGPDVLVRRSSTAGTARSCVLVGCSVVSPGLGGPLTETLEQAVNINRGGLATEGEGGTLPDLLVRGRCEVRDLQELLLTLCAERTGP